MEMVFGGGEVGVGPGGVAVAGLAEGEAGAAAPMLIAKTVMSKPVNK